MYDNRPSLVILSAAKDHSRSVVGNAEAGSGKKRCGRSFSSTSLRTGSSASLGTCYSFVSSASNALCPLSAPKVLVIPTRVEESLVRPPRESE